jgi:hypothetical protein
LARNAQNYQISTRFEAINKRNEELIFEPKFLRFLRVLGFLSFHAINLFASIKKGPPRRTQVLQRMNGAGYLLSSTRDAIML